jgi:hypothetical protein
MDKQVQSYNFCIFKSHQFILITIKEAQGNS